jgi:hypothetical protein
MFVKRVGAPLETPLMPSTLPRTPTTLLPLPPPPLLTALTLPWNGGGGTMAVHRGALRSPTIAPARRLGRPTSPMTSTSPSRPCLHRPARSPTPTWRPTAARAYVRTPSEPGSSPPRPRRGRFPGSERPRKGRWGRIHRSRLVATASVAGAHQKWPGSSPLAGLHGRCTGLGSSLPWEEEEEAQDGGFTHQGGKSRKQRRRRWP